MADLWNGVGPILLYFLICASSALLLHAFFPIPSEVFRKLLHMILLGSLSVWAFAFPTWQLSAVTAVAFALLVYPILSLAERLKGFSQLLTERKTGEIKHSLLLVFGMYALVIAICWGWMEDKLLGLASIYAWGFGDAAAALVGKRFGKHPLRWRGLNGKKTAEGTFAMFAVSVFSVLCVLLVRGGLPVYAVLLIAVITAAVSALVELYTPNGMDTFTCPMAAMAVLLPLVALFGGLL